MPWAAAHTRDASGGEGDRTPDLVNAIHALSQLSYAPEVRAAEPHTCVSAGNRETYPRVYTKSSKWGWRKSPRPIFCSAFCAAEGARKQPRLARARNH